MKKTLLLFLIMSALNHALDVPRFLAFFKEQMERHSEYLTVDYSPESGFRAVAKTEIPVGAGPLITIPPHFVVTACKAL